MNEISSVLDYFDLDKNNKLIKLLNQLVENEILNEELYINLVKALVLLFQLNKNNYNIYCNIFSYIVTKMDNKVLSNCFNKLKTVKLAKQLVLSDIFIEDIIIFTHEYILNNITHKLAIDKVLIDWINIIYLIQQLKLSFELKIYYYLYIIKHPLNTYDINILVHLINFFIK